MKTTTISAALTPMTAEDVYEYALARGERAPELEDIIIDSADSLAAMEYARDIVEGRWPEAEGTIRRDRGVWADYTDMLNQL